MALQNAIVNAENCTVLVEFAAAGSGCFAAPHLNLRLIPARFGVSNQLASKKRKAHRYANNAAKR